MNEIFLRAASTRASSRACAPRPRPRGTYDVSGNGFSCLLRSPRRIPGARRALKSVSTVAATKAILEEIGKLKTKPPTPTEMRKAKDQVMNSFSSSTTTRRRRRSTSRCCSPSTATPRTSSRSTEMASKRLPLPISLASPTSTSTSPSSLSSLSATNPRIQPASLSPRRRHRHRHHHPAPTRPTLSVNPTCGGPSCRCFMAPGKLFAWNRLEEPRAQGSTVPNRSLRTSGRNPLHEKLTPMETSGFCSSHHGRGQGNAAQEQSLPQGPARSRRPGHLPAPRHRRRQNPRALAGDIFCIVRPRRLSESNPPSPPPASTSSSRQSSAAPATPCRSSKPGSKDSGTPLPKHLLVLSGDVPLIRPETIAALRDLPPGRARRHDHPYRRPTPIPPATAAFSASRRIRPKSPPSSSRNLSSATS